jgi:hypothetical protein
MLLTQTIAKIRNCFSGWSESGAKKRSTARLGFGTIENLEARALLTSPVVTNFDWVHNTGNIYTFSGHVAESGESTEDFEVDFGGILQGYTATVDQDGNFQLTVRLNYGGGVSVQTWDWDGDPSNVAQTWVNMPA